MKKLLYLFLFTLCSTISYGQQEQMYTQFMYNKLAINPGYAGHEKVWSLTALYRNQWLGFDGAPDAQVLSLNSPILLKRIGLGLNIKRQAIGITELITIEGLYSYKLRLGKGLLSLGIQISGRNYTVNYQDERLFGIHDISLDPSIPTVSHNKQYLNTGFGLYYNNQNFYIGASIPRLIRADLSFTTNGDESLFSDEKRHIYFMTGVEIYLSEHWSMTPQALFKIAENTPFDLDFDFNFSYQSKYSLGANYRYGGAEADFGESIDLIFGVQANDNIYAAIAYDIGLSKLRSHHNGSIELMVHYKFKKSNHTVEHVNPRFY